MGCLCGCIKRIIKLIIYLTLIVTTIVIIPNLPPYTKFSSIPLTPVKERTGALAPNDELNNAQKLYEGKILGPEAFQIWQNELYTSLATGEIVKFSPGGHVTFVTKIGQPCSGLIQEHICGCPLGFKIDEKNGIMYVADAYHGIWKVDIKTDKKQQLVSPDVPIDGRKPKLFNSVAVDKNGGVYWTDSSSDYNLKDGAYIGLSDPSGRLFYYSPLKKESKVLLDDLWFANGLVLSPDESFVVVAETLKQRLVKYYISGPKQGKSEIFLDGIPGTPDNVRVLPDGSGLLIGLYSVSDENNPMLTYTLATVPVIRKFVARISRLIEIPFEYLNSQFPNPIFEEIVFRIGHISTVSLLAPEITGLLVVDWNGNIITSYYNTDRSIRHMSDAIVYNDKLMIGAPHNQNFVGAVPVPSLLKKAFSTQTSQKPVEKEVRKDVPTVKSIPTEKPVTKVTPKPTEKVKTTTTTTTTTTPKPQTKPVPPKQQVTPPPKKEEVKPKKVEKQDTKQAPPTKQAESKPTEKVKEPNSNKINQDAKTKNDVNNENKKESKSSESKTKTKVDSKPAKSDTNKKDKVEKPDIPVKKEKENVKTKKANDIPVKEKAAPSHIPIVEDIPSDTAKPNKEKLKVIKKSGPDEIPSPYV